MHWPLCYIPVAASAGLEPAISCSRDRRLSHFAYDAIKYRLQELNPDYSLLGQACCQLHQVGIRCKRKLPASHCLSKIVSCKPTALSYIFVSKSWLREEDSNFQFLSSEPSVLPVTPSRNEGRTTGLEPALTRATISRLILSATFAINSRDGETRTL